MKRHRKTLSARASDGPLDGRVAVVTGGAQGIGRAICETLARDGATVVVADLSLDGAGACARAISQQGGRGLAMHVDVSDEALVQALYGRILCTAKRLDILVNNAGICR
ncbi:MAG: SDR family NAD(P)-dependent oxidoreductase, partial [Kiritimatiellaeota bacterium]|nr:SDR family NAD(P)-dependent oxidoreductase [Kiritimatiellota bacterium]